jgi:hypothetical protein
MSLELPYCSVQNPSCGACGGDTRHDGDSFYCEDCLLDYGTGEDGETATYLDEEAEPCGNPCDNSWHTKFDYAECKPCSLPKGHHSDHWTPCRP